MQPPVIALVGPTASGKSSLALSIARQAAQLGHTIELISMDSALVYRGMDIGTAKPTQAEMKEIPHHGINLCEPHEVYSAAQFAKDASQWIQVIWDRGHIPMIVGGTMLYWRALAHGLSNMPAASPAIRFELDQLAQEKGWPYVHAQLSLVDPVTALRLQPNDSQRIQRAMEIYRISGKPMSDWLQEQPKHSGRREDLDPTFNLRLISIEPSDRKYLHSRIAERFDMMLAEGFLDEMRTLYKNPLLHPDLPSMRAVGYRQAWDYLSKQITFEEFKNQAIAATRQLAKRQLTWLRGIENRESYDSLDSAAMLECQKECLRHYQITTV